MSCATTTFCAAVDWLGNALVWHGTSWTAPPSPARTTPAAAPAPAPRPAATPTAGPASRPASPARRRRSAPRWTRTATRSPWTAARWSRPVSLDPIAGVLSSVSCASPRFCAAVDDNGYAFEWNGRSWSTTAYSVTSPADRTASLTSVSCPTRPVLRRRGRRRPRADLERLAWSAPRRHRPARRRADLRGLRGQLVVRGHRRPRRGGELERHPVVGAGGGRPVRRTDLGVVRVQVGLRGRGRPRPRGDVERVAVVGARPSTPTAAA